MHVQQTGGKEINQTVTFHPLLLTNGSYNTRQTSVVQLLICIRKFGAQLNNKCTNPSKSPHSGVTFFG